MSIKKLTNLIKNILVEIGEDISREGLKDTPKRVAKMYKELFIGYKRNKKPLLTTFDNEEFNQIICDKGYFYSHCEHHMVPFFGEYYFGYIPKKRIIGLSKIARLIDYFSARLQVQERLTKEIVNEIEKNLNPEGIILIMKARHLCKEMRGVKKNNSEMTTIETRGIFKENDRKRREFLDATLLNSNLKSI